MLLNSFALQCLCDKPGVLGSSQKKDKKASPTNSQDEGAKTEKNLNSKEDRITLDNSQGNEKYGEPDSYKIYNGRGYSDHLPLKCTFQIL